MVVTHSKSFAVGADSLPQSLVAAGSGGSARIKVCGSPRRGSVLVLVMTLLGILFVVGVAFLATMNFEADMISAERVRAQSDGGVEAAAAGASSILRNAVMAGPGMPFGDSSLALTASAFAELPGVQNSFSPIEPTRRVGPDGRPFTPDDSLVFEGFFDVRAQSRTTFDGPSMPPYFAIDTNLVNGVAVSDMTVTLPNGSPATVTFGRCKGGADNGLTCDPANPCTAPSVCEFPRVADADGDGIVDSLLINAKEMGLSEAQLADLAARVNPSGDLNGEVTVAIRVVPHGGMVNLNESHPLLIQNIFDLPVWPTPGQAQSDPETGFRHGPTQDGLAYSSALEESLLRRRNNIPPREFQPSYLHGNPFLDPQQTASGQAHMQRQLFWSRWPGGAAANQFQSVYPLAHDFTPFVVNLAGEKLRNYPSNSDYKYWDVMMDAELAAVASPILNIPIDYDRRHLVTTVSHDDLLARTAIVETPTGRKDLRQAMIEANWTNFDPDQCLPLMPFEIVNYPAMLDDEKGRQIYDKANYCCPDDPKCGPGPTKGRLQLSLPWIDDQLAAAASTSLSVQQQNEYRNRIFRTIHDAFYLLVRNATRSIEVEGMPCNSNSDCVIIDTVCGTNGLCVHARRSTSFTKCVSSADCEQGFPGSMCRSDGICTMSAPAWRDAECTNNGECRSDEYCQILPSATLGVCADRWTRLRRSEALVSRTAASLTANMIDFVDSDNSPVQIAVRNFDFSLRCNSGSNHNSPCTGSADCPGGTCMNLAGRDIDTDPSAVGVQGVYVYGLERQPYITEIATFAKEVNGQLAIVARAIELFNPYNSTMFLDNEYFVLEVPPDATTVVGLPLIQLSGVIVPNTGGAPTGPFSTLATANDQGDRAQLRDPPRGVELGGTGDLEFLTGYTIYLLRSLDPSDPNAPKIVIDQVTLDDTSNVGKEGLELAASGNCGGNNQPRCRFSIQRVVQQPANSGEAARTWTWTVPFTAETPDDGVTLGTWNSVANSTIHPVEVNFSNTGRFGASLHSTVAPSFPTTGSLALLMRTASRSISEFSPPQVGGATGPARELAFNTILAQKTQSTRRSEDSPGSVFWQEVEVDNYELIDNGRIPLFDEVGNAHPLHHLPPSMYKAWDPTGATANTSTRVVPGSLQMLPWGQLLFDYFTALPLANSGPYYFDTSDPDETKWSFAPRVDEGGLRVHGRVNINAAPWKVLAGLPFIPSNQLPAEFRTKISGILGSDPGLGPELAQAIVAYRDARAFFDPAGSAITGNYDTGLPAAGSPSTQPFGRGWMNAAPAIRRGTGFMTVGELANVRHPGAAVVGGLPPTVPYRIDSGVIGSDTNKNNEDFVEAAAVLIALGDWVSVRSHVFTVYGQIRGADDPTLPPAMQLMDTDARAIRFQETIDRLPVLQGRGRPTRIGERTVGKYTDVNND